MILDYTQLPLKELERLAYMEQNALALACLQVAEGEGIDPDDYANLEKRIEDLEDSLDAYERDIAEISRERDEALDKLDTMEQDFQDACDELATVRAELEELRNLEERS